MFIDINRLVGFKNIKERPKLARVIANNDPTKKARIKVEIEGIFKAEDSSGSNLPWIRQEGSSFNGVQQFQVPDIGSLVELNWRFGSRIPTYRPAPYETNSYDNKFSTDYPYTWGWADDSGFALFVNRKTGKFTLKTQGAVITGDSGGNINITGGNVIIQGNTKIDGKIFLEHKHSNGHGGGDTGGVV